MTTARYTAIYGIALLLQLTLPIFGVRAADDIIMGFAIGQSGLMQALDGDSSRMALLFIDQVNAKGGLLGRQLKPVIIDTKSDRAEGAKAGLSLANQGANLIFTSCDYDFGAPAALQAQRAGIVSVFLCAGDPKAGIAGVGPYSFTAATAAQVEGVALAGWGYNAQKYRNVYVLLDDSIEYDKSVVAGFDWAFPAAGGRIAGRDTFKNGDASIASQVTRLANTLRDQTVDAVMICSYPPGGASAIRQIRAAGVKLPILACSAMDGTYWLGAVPDLDKFYVVAFAAASDDPRPGIPELMKAFTTKYGSPPATGYAMPIYAWLELWTKAVTSVGTTDAKAVVPAMEKFTDEATILGSRSFSSKLHIQDKGPWLIEEVSAGALKVVTLWDVKEPVPPKILYRTKSE